MQNWQAQPCGGARIVKRAYSMRSKKKWLLRFEFKNTVILSEVQGCTPTDLTWIFYFKMFHVFVHFVFFEAKTKRNTRLFRTSKVTKVYFKISKYRALNSFVIILFRQILCFVFGMIFESSCRYKNTSYLHSYNNSNIVSRWQKPKN